MRTARLFETEVTHQQLMHVCTFDNSACVIKFVDGFCSDNLCSIKIYPFRLRSELEDSELMTWLI
ncbi:hypothetical protein NTGM5_20003 [Candidatus Nitrotoga sp. M5]|nr:hypothetical protein NTGM5_20003 [Candidatus Nitrotoga sp. M5]